MPISRNIKKAVLTLWTCSLIFLVLVFANRHLETQNRSYFCHMHRPLEFYKGTKVNVISLKLAVVIPLTLLAILCSIFNYGHVGHLEKKPVKTPVQSYSNSKEGYPDNDRSSCFISHLLGSFQYIGHTLVSRPCKIQSGFHF